MGRPIESTDMASCMGDDALARAETDKQASSKTGYPETKSPDASYIPLPSAAFISSRNPLRLHVNTPQNLRAEDQISPSGLDGSEYQMVRNI